MKNTDYLNRSAHAVWHPCTQMKQHERLPLLPISHGQGVWLVDYEGQRYLDAISSWWVNLFGHANPQINAALKDQLDQVEHVMLAGLTHAPVIELSEQLAQLAPGQLGHCFYGSDGASAIEIALKMSFHFWRNAGQTQKTGFISIANGYHGETLGALSVTDVALFKDTYAPLLRQTYQAPSPDVRLAAPGESAEAYARRAADVLAEYLAQHHATTAALIVEPLVQCAGGMAMHHPIYLKRVRELCDQYAVHLIADEIAVGFGRTGTLFACEQADIAPDFLCLSKGLTGGYLPLSVVMCTEAIYQAFYHAETARGFLHSHSYTGNPLACRAALATLAIFAADEVIAANQVKAAVFTQAMQALREHPRVRHFRHLGMIWAFDVTDAAPNFSQAFFQAALQHGLLLRPLGNTVYFMPPYVIDAENIALLVQGTLACLDRV